MRLDGQGKKRLRLGIGAGCVALSSLFWWSIKGDGMIAKEHALMENLQALCLATGALALWVQRSDPGNSGTKQALRLAALAYFTMLLLEFDVRPFNIAWLTHLLSGPIRNVWLGAAWVYYVSRAVKDWRQIIYQGKTWARSATGIILTISAMFWIAGAVVEDLKLYSHKQNLFIEELMESNAALLMLWAAVEIAIDPHRKKHHKPMAGLVLSQKRAEALCCDLQSTDI